MTYHVAEHSSSLCPCVDVLLSMPVRLVLQEDQTTALICAAGRGHEQAVRLLLQRGAKVDHQVCTASLAL